MFNISLFFKFIDWLVICWSLVSLMVFGIFSMHFIVEMILRDHTNLISTCLCWWFDMPCEYDCCSLNNVYDLQSFGCWINVPFRTAVFRVGWFLPFWLTCRSWLNVILNAVFSLHGVDRSIRQHAVLYLWLGTKDLPPLLYQNTVSLSLVQSLFYSAVSLQRLIFLYDLGLV